MAAAQTEMHPQVSQTGNTTVSFGVGEQIATFSVPPEAFMGDAQLPRLEEVASPFVEPSVGSNPPATRRTSSLR